VAEDELSVAEDVAEGVAEGVAEDELSVEGDDRRSVVLSSRRSSAVAAAAAIATRVLSSTNLDVVERPSSRLSHRSGVSSTRSSRPRLDLDDDDNDPNQ